jgi:Dr1-associated corepressor
MESRIAKALELFMISLVTKSATQAKTRGSKRVTASHLKSAVMAEEQFDFLHEIVANVPDAPPPGQQSANALGQSEEEDEGKKKKKVGRRKKNTGMDEDD